MSYQTTVVVTRCSGSLYHWLFVGGLMSYLRYLHACLRRVVFNTYVVLFLFCFPSSCVSYVASFSGMSFFDCFSHIL